MENKPNKPIDTLHPVERDDLARLDVEIKTLTEKRRALVSNRHRIIARASMRFRKQKASGE
jgi:hypothetical protein